MQAIDQQDLYEKAKSKALRLLTARQRTAQEIVERLTAAGFEQDLADRVAERLQDVGLLNDELVAGEEIQRGLRKGLSRAAIRRSLLSKGVASGVIEEGLAVSDTEPELARATSLASKRAASLMRLEPIVARRRLTQYLMSRGFDPETVDEAARVALGGSTDLTKTSSSVIDRGFFPV